MEACWIFLTVSFFVVWIVRKCIHSCIHQWETISEWRTTRNENNAQVHLSVHFSFCKFLFFNAIQLQCKNVMFCVWMCVVIVMNEKHNNRSGNSFRAHHRSSKKIHPFHLTRFANAIWNIDKRKMGLWNEEKKTSLSNGERGESNYYHSYMFFVQIHQYAIIHSWHREFTVFCVRLSTLFFLSFFFDQWNWIATQRHLRQHELMFLSFHSSFIFCIMNELQWRLNGCTIDSLFINKIGFSRIPNHLTHSFFSSSILASFCIAKTKLSHFRHLFKFRSVV